MTEKRWHLRGCQLWSSTNGTNLQSSWVEKRLEVLGKGKELRSQRSGCNMEKKAGNERWRRGKRQGLHWQRFVGGTAGSERQSCERCRDYYFMRNSKRMKCEIYHFMWHMMFRIKNFCCLGHFQGVIWTSAMDMLRAVASATDKKSLVSILPSLQIYARFLTVWMQLSTAFVA